MRLLPRKCPRTGTQVNGSLNFNGGGANYFDAANGFVPSGYGNSAGQPVTIGSATEFGFQDGANTDAADFTDTQLIITDNSVSGGASSTYTFTSLTPGAFAGLTLVGSNFAGGFTYGLIGDTITVNFDGFESGGQFQTVFSVAAGSVPEPATWAMMLLGFGAVGGTLRRSHRNRAVEAIA